MLRAARSEASRAPACRLVAVGLLLAGLLLIDARPPTPSRASVLGASIAQAQSESEDGCRTRGGNRRCRATRPGQGGDDGGGGGGGGGAGGGGGGGVSARPIYRAIQTTGFTTPVGDETGPCWMVTTGGSQFYGTAYGLAVARGQCYGRNATPELVEIEDDLAVPTARVDEDATWVTGLEVFLEIDIAEIPAFPSEDFVLETSRQILVDWGDGTPEELVDPPGGPYPDGDITHVYDRAEMFTIEVKAVYSTTWVQEDGARVPLGDITLSDTVEVPVREVQAIRRR
jgi:hypothetical protein